jgi:predicted dehydrogenase
MIKTAVIGTGHLGTLHVKMLTAIPGATVTGVFDADPARAQSCAAAFNTAAYPSIEKLLADVDAVSIAATTSAHYTIAKQCLESGKHVFIEKPITAHISEAEELVLLARLNALILQVGHIERFNPALISLDKYPLRPMFVQSDRLAQFNPRGTDVAVVLDLMIHDIDIILNLVKSEVKSISASGVAVVSDTVDIANARLEFENGAVANVTASRISQKKMRKMRIFQRDAYITLDFSNGSSEIFRLLPVDQEVSAGHLSYGEIGIGEKRKKIVYEQPELKEVNALEYELGLFVDCVANNTQPVVSGEDGLRALKVAKEIIEKIEQSAKVSIS